MRKERRTLTGAFKAKVALEALQEKKTIAQLAAEYDLHANQISAWKKQLLEQSSQVFDQPAVVKDDTAEKLQEELFSRPSKMSEPIDYMQTVEKRGDKKLLEKRQVVSKSGKFAHAFKTKKQFTNGLLQHL